MKRNWQTFAGGTSAHHGNSYAMYLENGAMFSIDPPQTKYGAYSLRSFNVTAPHWVDHGKFRSPQAAKSAAKKILDEGKGTQRFKVNPRRRGSFTPQLREKFERGGDQEYRGHRIKKNDLIGVYEVSGPLGRGEFMTISDAKKNIDFLMGLRKNPRNKLDSYSASLRRVGKHNIRNFVSADHIVAVKRGGRWIKLGAFRSKAAAMDYAQAMAKAHKRQKFAYFEPGEKLDGSMKKNPASRFNIFEFQLAEHWAPAIINGDYSGLSDADAEMLNSWINNNTPGGGHWSGFDEDGSLGFCRDDVSGKQANCYKVQYLQPNKLKKNPAPRSEVTAAARRFQSFTGHRATRAQKVRLPQASAGFAVGPVLAVAYETTRDGKREKYMHEFHPGARPLLASSSDGRSLYLLGGAYRFTSRGIVDKRKR